MDDISTVPVYRTVRVLREEIASSLTLAAQAVLEDNFDEAEQILAETRRLVLVLQTVMEA